MRLAALGRTHWLYDSIQKLAEAGHQVVLIATSSASPEYQVTEEDFARLAGELKAEFINDAVLNRPQYVRRVRELALDVAVSVNCVSLLSEDLIKCFRRGVLNAHAGDLPRFRANAVPNWAILRGEPRVVLTVHFMTPELDAGPILLQHNVALNESTYIGDVYHELSRIIPDLFVQAVDGLAKQTLTPRQQPTDPSLSLRCYPRLPRDGQIDWKRPAVETSRLVRASSEPFAGAYTFLDAEILKVWRARPGELGFPHCGVPGQVVGCNTKAGEVSVLTGDGILVLEEVEVSSRGRVPPA